MEVDKHSAMGSVVNFNAYSFKILWRGCPILELKNLTIDMREDIL